MSTEYDTHQPPAATFTEDEVVDYTEKNGGGGGVANENKTYTNTTTNNNSSSSSVLRDIYEWKRKDLSVSVLLGATAIWVVLQVYKFNFIPLFSYAAIFIFTSAFIWGNLLRLFGKEGPRMAGVEIAEESIRGIAYSVKESGEEMVRWMFRVGAEKQWFVFLGTLIALWLLSLIGTYVDFLTFLYIGTVVGMSGPVLYKRYENKIMEYYGKVSDEGNRVYGLVNDKVLRKIKDQTTAAAAAGHEQIKQHKTE